MASKAKVVDGAKLADALGASYRVSTVQNIPLRDWFAGMALMGRSANQEQCELNTAVMAASCYEQADAMLAERNK